MIGLECHSVQCRQGYLHMLSYQSTLVKTQILQLTISIYKQLQLTDISKNLCDKYVNISKNNRGVACVKTASGVLL